MREQIGKVFGLIKKRDRTQEEIIVSKSRNRARLKRSFRNRIANGEDVTVPWGRPRTLRAIVNEERALNIAQKWQRMGEFKR